MSAKNTQSDSVSIGDFVILKPKKDSRTYGIVTKRPDRFGIFEAATPSGLRQCHTTEVVGAVEENIEALIEERDELNNWTGEYRARISSLEDKLKKAEKKEPVIETKVIEKDPDPALKKRIKELEAHVKRLIKR